MNIKTLTIACGLAVSLLGQPALVGQFEDGVVAANRENHSTEMQILLPFSVQGNADPQYNLSGIYRIGQGFLRDDAETLKLVLSVVDQDNCDES